MTIDPHLLDPGETLIWSGRTMPLVYALRKSWSIFLFGIVFFPSRYSGLKVLPGTVRR
jgi:hypothetical protein